MTQNPKSAAPGSGTKVRWYAISYLLLSVPVMVAYLSGHPGPLPGWLVKTAWAASAGGGIFCALIGGGGLNRKPIDGMASLALILHLGSAGVLMAVAFSAGAL